ncbi:MAG: imelysin family protein [Microthrixaceae bacterium]
MRLPSRTAILLAVAVLSVGCSRGSDDGGSEPQGPDREAVITEIADDVIVPGYDVLATTTTELAGAIDQLCTNAQPDSLESARQAWNEAISAWMFTMAFEFGPVRSLRSAAKISYPLDVDKVAELADPASVEPLDPAAVEALGADARGLNAVQELLFKPAGTDALSARQCSYALAASDLVAAGAMELSDAWTQGVDGEAPARQQFTNPGGDAMWSSPTEVLEDLLNSMLSTLSEVDRVLAAATGADGELTDPTELDAAPAHRVLEDLVDQLEGVAAVYGDSTADPPTGMSQLVAASASEDSETDQAIRDGLDDAISSIESVPSTLFEFDPAADPDAQGALERATDDVMTVRSALATEVASLLGLTVGFSDSDGDA